MFNTVELDNDILVLLGDDQQSNSILLSQAESLIVVDTFSAGRDAERLGEIVCCQGAPLRYIVNTHWHSDHIGGNRGLKNMFPESSIIAHDAYRDTITAEEGIITNYSKPDPASYPAPQIVIGDHYEIIPDFQMINVGGHTRDSCIVYIPGKSLVLCGDVVLSAGVNGGVSIPYFYWGNPYELLPALEMIRKLNPLIIIPGHGWIVKPDILDAHILYLEKLLKIYKEYCYSAEITYSGQDLPEALELENIVDCSKGAHWTFRKMHLYNLRRLEQLAKIKSLL